MKILILSTFERKGGAAVAANRLMQALNRAGHEAKMLVRDKQTDDPNVATVNTNWWKKKINFIRFACERWVIFSHNRFSKKNLFAVSIANTGTDISRHPLVKEADIINLHWINQGFLSLADIRKLTELNKPVVWTIHDMWPCTGICHYAWGCEGFTSVCGNCSFLLSRKKKDLSYQIRKKKQFLSKSNIQIVTVSSWLKAIAKRSVVMGTLNISVIPNVIDTSIFHPTDKCAMRSRYSFHPAKKIIIMGASTINNPIKGFDILCRALSLLAGKRNDLFVILFGKVRAEDSFLSDLSVEYVCMGEVTDASIIAELYAAADVTVVPSYYETFGQTLIESMACGCPVVSFDNSGQTDIIDHQINGYLAKYKDAEDLASGINWCLAPENRGRLSQQALLKARTCYAENVVAQQYVELYKSKY